MLADRPPTPPSPGCCLPVVDAVVLSPSPPPSPLPPPSPPLPPAPALGFVEIAGGHPRQLAGSRNQREVWVPWSSGRAPPGAHDDGPAAPPRPTWKASLLESTARTTGSTTGTPGTPSTPCTATWKASLLAVRQQLSSSGLELVLKGRVFSPAPRTLSLPWLPAPTSLATPVPARSAGEAWMDLPW